MPRAFWHRHSLAALCFSCRVLFEVPSRQHEAAAGASGERTKPWSMRWGGVGCGGSPANATDAVSSALTKPRPGERPSSCRPCLLLTLRGRRRRSCASSKGSSRDLELARETPMLSARDRRVRGVELLASFSCVALFESFSRLRLSSLPPFRRSARAHSLSSPQFSLFREQRNLLSWTPWRLRGLPRYADGRARESGKASKKRPPLLHPTLSQLASLSLSPSSLHLNPSQSQVFVGGLSWATDDAKLRQYFSNFGEVSEVKKMKNEKSPSRRRRRRRRRGCFLSSSLGRRRPRRSV